MKNFKDLVSEVAINPKAPEEKRFKDQHTIEVIPHPVAPDPAYQGQRCSAAVEPLGTHGFAAPCQ